MWSRLRILDQATLVVGEPVLDTVFVVRNRPGHRVIALIGLVMGVALGAAPFGLWSPVTVMGVIAGGGLGLNLGTDFRFLALTDRRLVAIESSRAAAWPRQCSGTVDPQTLCAEGRGIWTTMTIEGRPHWTARAHRARVARMVASVSVSQPTSSHQAE